MLSVITGGGKWVEIATHADPLYQHLIVTAERKFWRCVESGEPPRLFGVEPPKPRIEAIRIVDMSASNSWAEFAGLFRSTRQAFLEHERSKAELKALMPEDAKEAIGHGVRAKRSKSGAISFDLLDVEGSRAASLVRSIASLAAALAKAQAELVNPEKSLVATIRSDGPARGSNRRFVMPHSRVDSISFAKRWASMRSPQYRPRRSTKPPASLISPRYWRTPRENGLPRTGQSAPSARLRRRIGWVQR